MRAGRPRRDRAGDPGNADSLPALHHGDLERTGLAEHVTAQHRIESDVADLLGGVRGTLDEQNRCDRQTPQPTASN